MAYGTLTEKKLDVFLVQTKADGGKTSIPYRRILNNTCRYSPLSEDHFKSKSSFPEGGLCLMICFHRIEEEKPGKHHLRQLAKVDVIREPLCRYHVPSDVM